MISFNLEFIFMWYAGIKRGEIEGFGALYLKKGLGF